MCYPFSVNKLGESSEALSTTLRLIEFITVLRNAGDCIVILFIDPGPNLLAHYFPHSKSMISSSQRLTGHVKVLSVKTPNARKMRKNNSTVIYTME